MAPWGMKSAPTRAESISSTSPVTMPAALRPFRMQLSASRCMSCTNPGKPSVADYRVLFCA